MSSLKHNTREAWLRSAAKLLAPLFQSVDATLPPELQFSAAPISQGAIGTCHDKQHSSDEKTRNITICASLSDPLDKAGVLPTLMHELVHAAVGGKHGHRGEFARVARALGLEGRLTATRAGEDLLERLKPIAEELGPYPGVATKKGKKRRSWKRGQTKHIRLRSLNDYDYWVYMPRDLYEDQGAPLDPEGDAMVSSREIGEAEAQDD